MNLHAQMWQRSPFYNPCAWVIRQGPKLSLAGPQKGLALKRTEYNLLKTLELLRGSHVYLKFRPRRNWAEIREGMVEWNRIFRSFQFTGILGQPREVHLKFRNEIPENVLSIRSSPGISEIFGRMESAPRVNYFRERIGGNRQVCLYSPLNGKESRCE